MSALTIVAAGAFAVALLLFLAGFVRLADSAGAGTARRREIAAGGALIAGGVAIWGFTLGVVGGLL